MSRQALDELKQQIPLLDYLQAHDWLLMQSKSPKIPWSFAPDGKRLAYFETAGIPQLWTVPARCRKMGT